MKYVLVNHIPVGVEQSSGALRIGELWLEDLRTQVESLRALGMHTVLTAPAVSPQQLGHSGGFQQIAVDPLAEGFTYCPLPYCVSRTAVVVAYRQICRCLEHVLRDATMVQVSADVYGRIAWHIAGQRGVKRIWLFDGGDYLSQQQVLARSEPKWLKRQAKKLMHEALQMFVSRAVRKADLVFAHNPAVRDHFGASWDARCHLFDRSFVTEKLIISSAEIRRRQSLLRDRTKPLRLVVAARQVAIKATDHVLRALKIARDRGANIELLVLGDGDQLPEYRALSVSLGLDSCVRFAGAVPYGPELFGQMSQCHVCVVTNLVVELSRNILLAMALGLPLVLYRNAGHDSLIADNGAGKLVPRGDVDALATAFCEADVDRESLLVAMENGVSVAATRTLNACHSRRAQLAFACTGAIRDR